LAAKSKKSSAVWTAQRFIFLPAKPFDPRISGPLTGREGVKKSYVGIWRILFTADRTAKILNILTVDTRGQVYKRS